MNHTECDCKDCTQGRADIIKEAIASRRTRRVYKCTRCGCEDTQATNHKGPTYSFGRFNCCPNCPPWAKFSDMGGTTEWRYVREA